MSPMRAQIAFDLSLTAGVNFFTLDDVEKGVLDNTEYVLGGDVLVDVTQYLRSVDVDRGRSQQLEKFTAGRANIILDNRSRIFDPTFAASPFFGNIVPRKQLVLDVDEEEIFTGFVEDWNFDYPGAGFDATAQVSASDGFSVLAQQDTTAGTATAQLTGARISAVLDAAGWSAVKRSIGPGQSLLDADVRAPGVNVLSYLQVVETSEFGALFVNRAGAITFKDRAQLQAFTTGVTFGPSGIPVTGIGIQFGTEEMKNSVAITFTAAGVVAGTAVSDDLVSQASYGVIDVKYATILSSSVEANSLASFLTGIYSEPQYRVDELTVSVDALSSGQKASILDLDLGDVVIVGFTPSAIGPAISQVVSIDKIGHRVVPGRHEMVITLSEARASFILDDPVFGVLDTSILGF